MTQLKVGLVCFPFIGLRVALYRALNGKHFRLLDLQSIFDWESKNFHHFHFMITHHTSASPPLPSPLPGHHYHCPAHHHHHPPHQYLLMMGATAPARLCSREASLFPSSRESERERYSPSYLKYKSLSEISSQTFEIFSVMQ